MSRPDSPSEERLVGDLVDRLRGVRGTTAVELLPLVYDQLRSLARSRLALLRPGHTLQATALVHEAWLRLIENGDPGWDGRAHFFGAASRAMRLILVENARRKMSLRRGGDRDRRPLSDVPEIQLDAPPEEILALNDALERFAELNPLKARIVLLKFFGGLSLLEVSEVIGCGLTKVEKEWRFARAWLQSEVEASLSREGVR